MAELAFDGGAFPTETRLRRFSRGGEFAAILAQASPWLGAAWAAVLVLLPPPDGAAPILPQPSGFSWLLCGSGLVCAYFMWKMIRSGLRRGRLSEFRLLIAGALPWAFGLLLTPIALFQVWKYGIMQGASIDVIVEPAIAPRFTGLVIGSQLLGAAGFALAVLGFLWRSPGRRWQGLWRALVSLAPFSGFVVVWMALDRLTPLLLRAEWILFALLTLPLRYALAGAVVTRPPASEPGVEWALSVPLAGAVLFIAAAILYFDQSLVMTFSAISAVDGAEVWPIFTNSLSTAAAFGLIGLLLLLLPAGVLLTRHFGPGSRLREAIIGHGRILLLAGGLVMLESLANWHVTATIKDAVFAQPRSGPQIEHAEAEPAVSGYAPPPPPLPHQAKRLHPIQVPDTDVQDDFPPDFPHGGEPEPEPESTKPGTPVVVIFTQLMQGAIYRPEFSLPEHIKSELRRQNRTEVAITMKLVIGEEGQVNDIVLQKRSGLPELDQHAVETGKQWLFRPYLVNGVPTAVASYWTIIYQLQ